MRAEGLILAGGKSSRMGGNHKGDLKIGEETFLEHLVKELAKDTQKIWLSYGDKIHRVHIGCETVMDEYRDCGPIGGLHATLKRANCDIMYVAACDMPFLKTELYRFLRKNMEETQDGAVPVVEGRVHPLAAVYRKRILPALEEQIKNKNYKLTGMLEKINVRYVDVSEYPEFCCMLRNINTVEEYEQMRKGECGWRD